VSAPAAPPAEAQVVSAPTFLARIQAAHLDAVAFWTERREHLAPTDGVRRSEFLGHAQRHVTQAQLLARVAREGATSHA
jgi:hypothetical protein